MTLYRCMKVILHTIIRIMSDDTVPVHENCNSHISQSCPEVAKWEMYFVLLMA